MQRRPRSSPKHSLRFPDPKSSHVSRWSSLCFPHVRTIRVPGNAATPSPPVLSGQRHSRASEPGLLAVDTRAEKGQRQKGLRQETRTLEEGPRESRRVLGEDETRQLPGCAGRGSPPTARCHARGTSLCRRTWTTAAAGSGSQDTGGTETRTLCGRDGGPGRLGTGWRLHGGAARRTATSQLRDVPREQTRLRQ